MQPVYVALGDQQSRSCAMENEQRRPALRLGWFLSYLVKGCPAHLVYAFYTKNPPVAERSMRVLSSSVQRKPWGWISLRFRCRRTSKPFLQQQFQQHQNRVRSFRRWTVRIPYGLCLQQRQLG